MKILLLISLRNLFRQKRRNILLGTAMAIGMMILVISSSFARGISDVLFNQIVTYVAGHVSINLSENGNHFRQVFHDGPWLKDLIKKEIPEATMVQESMGIFGRAIGNGKSDNVILVGGDFKAPDSMSAENKKKLQEETENNFKMIEGSFEDLSNENIENPILLSDTKAKYLNVKKGDIVKVRYRMINDQDQAARLTVAGIFKPSNMFMSAPVFLEVNTLKKLMGYRPNDLAIVRITLENPKKEAVVCADKIFKQLTPSLAQITGNVLGKTDSVQVSVLGFKTDSVSKNLFNRHIKTTDANYVVGKEDVLMSESLALALGVKVNDFVTVNYPGKYGDTLVPALFKITALYKNSSIFPSSVILVNEITFYNAFYYEWPKDASNFPTAYIPTIKNPLYEVLSPTWVVMPRAKTTAELTKVTREIGQKRLKGTLISVQSMYESASAVIQLEYALYIITFVAVIILFLIILIGVINTLRMTVKERTREIGTVRAIGMQRSDVRFSFIMETFFLTLFSAIAGIIGAFGVMKLLSLIKIDAQDNPLGMLLISGHLNFVPSVVSIIFFLFLILGIAVITAYFPARRAANLSAADALRHFE
jgi:ABC-type lipoprotein release transport system permease subunit